MQKLKITCDLCCSVGPEQLKEKLVSHVVPERPWAKITTDLFEFDGKGIWYFFVIDRLYSTTALSIIRKLKAHMVSSDISDEVIRDQGLNSPLIFRQMRRRSRGETGEENSESCQDVWTRSIFSFTRP